MRCAHEGASYRQLTQRTRVTPSYWLAKRCGREDRKRKLSPSRIDNLRGLLKAILPRQAEQLLAGKVLPWAGLRPMSADGVPFIGACGPTGLYVNCGHGHLGWTMADDSARMLADLVDGKSAVLAAADYSPRRFE